MSTDDVGRQAHRAFAKDCNNGAYDLLARPDRTDAETEAMVDMAHAAKHHWHEGGGTPVNEVRAEYLLGRVYAFAGRSEPALHHAGRALARAEDLGLGDFDLAFAHEGLARALACGGDLDDARAELSVARAVPIADAEDKEIFDADAAAGPWFGL
ncbi:MAG TPA: hypothetical protein VK461_09130 [Acidimicrobiales bacterium]|nr:hypothetical protein [Acidimicrobiales bacterium]